MDVVQRIPQSSVSLAAVPAVILSSSVEEYSYLLHWTVGEIKGAKVPEALAQCLGHSECSANGSCIVLPELCKGRGQGLGQLHLCPHE